MARPRIDELLERTGSRYALVLAASKRARQLNSYRQQSDAGSFETAVPPLVPEEKNDLSTALKEIAEGKIVVSEGAPSAAAERPLTPGSSLEFGFDLDA